MGQIADGAFSACAASDVPGSADCKGFRPRSNATFAAKLVSLSVDADDHQRVPVDHSHGAEHVAFLGARAGRSGRSPVRPGRAQRFSCLAGAKNYVRSGAELKIEADGSA